jgi:ATP sulfurylase
MRLANGPLRSSPSCSILRNKSQGNFTRGKTLALRDQGGVVLASLAVQELWQPDRHLETQAAFGSSDMSLEKQILN